LPFDTQDALRQALQSAHPEFLALDTVEPAAWGEFGSAGPLDSAPFETPVTNFYMTDSISRASETMAKCVDEILGTAEATGTDG